MGENKANGRSADHGAEKLATWSDNKDGGSLTNEDPCKNTIKKKSNREAINQVPPTKRHGWRFREPTIPGIAVKKP